MQSAGPTAVWRGFENEDVIVTGTHYQPFGQAINAPHFRVATMRFAHAPSHAVPLRSIGPEQLLRGSFVEHVWVAPFYEDDIRNGAILIVVAARNPEDARRLADSWQALGGKDIYLR